MSRVPSFQSSPVVYRTLTLRVVMVMRPSTPKPQKSWHARGRQKYWYSSRITANFYNAIRYLFTTIGVNLPIKLEILGITDQLIGKPYSIELLLLSLIHFRTGIFKLHICLLACLLTCLRLSFSLLQPSRSLIYFK